MVRALVSRAMPTNSEKGTWFEPSRDVHTPRRNGGEPFRDLQVQRARDGASVRMYDRVRSNSGAPATRRI